MRIAMNTGRGGAKAILLVIGGIIVLLLIFAFIFFSWAVGINNRIVRANQGADAAWAQVQNVYQRRLDLIPNLVNTVKGAASHELDLQIGVVQQRANASKIQINPSDPAQFQQFAQQQAQLGGALSRLLVTVENYPQVRANENFLNLQSQLEGTENRISVERQKFNQAVLDYNNMILVFPASMIASFRNFKQRPYFTADQGAEKAPTVDFGKQTPAAGGATTIGPTGSASATPIVATTATRSSGGPAVIAPVQPQSGVAATTTGASAYPGP